MSRHFSFGLLLLLCLLASTFDARAQSEVHTLGQLVDESPLIVVGMGLPERSSDGSLMVNVDHMRISVTSVIKGENVDSVLTLRTSARGRGEKPLFSFKSPILYFLQPDTGSTGWWVVSGNRSGSKVVSPFGLMTYSSHIQKYREIPDHNGVTNPDVLLEWSVQCIERKYGRNDGILEVIGKGYFFTDPEYDPKEALTVDQKKRILKVLPSIRNINYVHLELVPILIGVDDPKLKSFLLKLMKEPGDLSPRKALILMDNLNEIQDDQQFFNLKTQYEDIRWNDPDRKEKRRGIIAEYIEKSEATATDSDPVTSP